MGGGRAAATAEFTGIDAAAAEFSRRDALGEAHGVPLFGDCCLVWSEDDARCDEAKDAKLLLLSHDEGSYNNAMTHQNYTNATENQSNDRVLNLCLTDVINNSQQD